MMSAVMALVGIAASSAGHAQEGSTEPLFRLSEGQPVAVEAAVAASPVTPLTDRQIRPLLARLPPVAEAEGGGAAYRLPERSLPPPVPGEAVVLPFPPPAAPAVSAAGPLRVLRSYPRGEVSQAPHVGVIFSQPVVALGGPREPTSAENPVTLKPDMPGRWRWVGTDMLLFEAAAGRLPMATEFRARIDAGTRSAAGNALQEAVAWTFRTPAPTLRTGHPQDGPVRTSPLLFAAFDQRIDPAAVIEHVRVTTGLRTRAVRLSHAAEIDADADVRALVDAAHAGHWVAFAPVEPLPADTPVTVTFPAGTPSAEGPLVTERPQSFRFRTPAPLRLSGRRCGWWEGECRPAAAWVLSFTNPLDAERFDSGLIAIRPEPGDTDIQVLGDEIWIRPASRGRTTYTVAVSSGLADVFGQVLQQDVSMRFRVGPAEPRLSVPGADPATLAAGSAGVFPVHSVNVDRVRVRAFRVAPERYAEYLRWQRDRWDSAGASDPPGEAALERTLRVGGPEDAVTETGIDLADALDGATGHLILIVQPEVDLSSAALRDPARMQLMTEVRWVQATNLGITAFQDDDELLVWVSRLQDGAPRAGVAVELRPGGTRAVTDETGAARLPLPPSQEGWHVLVARDGGDVAFLAVSHWRNRNTETRFAVFDDRGVYRPGEAARIFGWLRRVGRGPGGDVRLFGPEAATRVGYRVTDPLRNAVAAGEAPLSRLGGFHFQVDLPEGINLGRTQVEVWPAGGTLDGEGDEHSRSIQVQEFRRPEFEVGATVIGGSGDGVHLAGGHALVTASARYFAGGPLPAADVAWRVSTKHGTYTPPNWSEFTFGRWTPWWRRLDDDPYHGYALESASFHSRTGADGRHHLRIDFVAGAAATPVLLDTTATVFDVNRQSWSGSAALLVHPADRYVGLRTGRYFVQQGEPLAVEVAVTDVDGNAIADHEVALRAVRIDWRYRDGTWRELERDVQACTLRTTAAGAEAAADPRMPPGAFASCSFETHRGGQYRITAVVDDAEGRRSLTELTRWVSGGTYPPDRGVARQDLRLIPDRDRYRPGDHARILVRAPFFPAEGMLTLRRDGLAAAERFSLAGPTHTLEVPITEQHLPNLHVQVDLVGTEEGRPAYAAGSLDLPVPPLSRTLPVTVAARAPRLEPGGTTTIDVTVQDAHGDPVADAELTVIVVDEAVLALAGYRLPDPVSVFYDWRSDGVREHHSRASVVLPAGTLDPAVLREMLRESGADPEFEPPPSPPNSSEPIAVRQDFAPLALFAPDLRTGPDGGAQVPVTLPHNLTRYRVMVVAAGGGRQFGAGESTLTAHLPLMVRPSAPRFLNYGDRFELPVVVQNQTEDALPVHVVVQAGNAHFIAGTAESARQTAGYAVTVPANDRVEVRVPTTAARAGTARFRFAAAAAADPAVADAAAIELPVFTPAFTEAFAAYGQLDGHPNGSSAALHRVRVPEAVLPDYGGLRVTLSSTVLQSLTDAFLYLVSYPYACSEQISSSIIGVAALRDVLTAFDAAGLPEPAAIEAAMRQNLNALLALQDDDGGFPIWRRGEDSWPYHSIHAAHALARAALAGYAVPADVLSRSRAYLRAIDRHVPGEYDRSARQALRSYALYVRALLGDHDPAEARRLLARTALEHLSAESIGWLLSVIAGDPDSTETVREVIRFLQNRVTETAGAATITTGYDDGAYLLLHSSRRSDAVLLEAMIAAQADSGLIFKLVRGLLGNRVKGRWANTQENVWVLLAMDRYFRTFESRAPDFTAGIWLGERYAGGREFRGRSVEQVSLDLPLSAVRAGAADGQTTPLTIGTEGDGRLYYRLGLRYATADLRQEPEAHGFTVERRYVAVDDPADVHRDGDGAWRIRAGSTVRVELKLVAPARRVHVALVDPLPAGLEILNPRLRWDGWWNWYEHHNLRDDRAEAFTSFLSAGFYAFHYTARATTPGAFVVPPATAEEMYAPETFGRTATDRVLIVADD